MSTLPERIVAYFRRHGRDLPWRRTRDAYAIWICEVMAQQTRLETVLPYWERWMARLPTVAALAAASLEDVLALWAGLGYYGRARNLHAAARAIAQRHGGRFPARLDEIAALPGIGRYTAGAVGSIAFGLRAPVVDGNVARVLARALGIESKRDIWERASDLVPATAPGDFNQGLMDLGALVCTPREPRCPLCPLFDLCVARRDGRVHELPVRPARRAPRLVHVDVVWVVRRGAWLLMRRAPRGLYGGLWELPEAHALGLAPAGAPLVDHVHQLTHRTLLYRVFPAALRARPRPSPPYDAARFTAPAQLATLAVSSATSALARALSQRDHPWPTPNAQPPSSVRASPRSSRASTSSATTSGTTRTTAAPPCARRTGSPR